MLRKIRASGFTFRHPRARPRTRYVFHTSHGRKRRRRTVPVCPFNFERAIVSGALRVRGNAGEAE